jgi:hypothetical protein
MVDVTVYVFYEAILKHLEAFYGNRETRVLYAGDRAGYRKSSANKDKRSDAKILVDEFNIDFRYRDLDLIESIKYMRMLLKPRKPCPCGRQLIEIDRKCSGLIGALEGGYHFPKNRSTGILGDKPYKDKFFDDIADAWRYGGENFVKWGIHPQDWVQHEGYQHKKKPQPWDWMEKTDKEIAEMLTTQWN